MVININFRKIPVSKFQEDSLSITVDYLAIESVINLFFNGKKITSLLGSPNDAKFLLVGHLLSEGYPFLSDFLLIVYATVSFHNMYKQSFFRSMIEGILFQYIGAFFLNNP